MDKNKIFTKIIATSLIFSIGVISSSEVMAYTKEETVYSKLDSQGNSYDTVVSEHIKNTDKEQLLKDMSELLEITNVNGDEEFKQDGNSLEWQACGNDIYYQGKINKTLPITSKITYTLDGEEISAKDLAGKSGKVTITIEYENKEQRRVKVNGKYVQMYVPFVVMAGTIFDNTKASNIEITNGKVVDNGQKTTVVALACPGLEESLGAKENFLPDLNKIEITLDAKDFEMENIMSYATPKVFENIDLSNMDQLNEIYSKISELQTASNKLVDGTEELKNGASALDEGVSEVSTGLHSLKSGVEQGKQTATSQLTQSAKALSDGVDQIIAGKDQETELIKKKVIEGGNTTLANGLKQNIPSAVEGQINSLMESKITQMVKNGQITPEVAMTLKSSLSMTEEEKAALASGLSTAIDGAVNKTTGAQEKGLDAINNAGLTAGSSEAGVKAGLYALKSQATTNIENGTKQIANGFDSIVDGTDEILAGTSKLKAGSNALAEGSSTLSDGMKEFNDEGISKVVSYINGDLKDIQERAEKLQELADSYNSFAGLAENEEGNVKFIFIVDKIRKIEEE